MWIAWMIVFIQSYSQAADQASLACLSSYLESGLILSEENQFSIQSMDPQCFEYYEKQEGVRLDAYEERKRNNRKLVDKLQFIHGLNVMPEIKVKQLMKLEVHSAASIRALSDFVLTLQNEAFNRCGSTNSTCMKSAYVNAMNDVMDLLETVKFKNLWAHLYLSKYPAEVKTNTLVDEELAMLFALEYAQVKLQSMMMLYALATENIPAAQSSEEILAVQNRIKSYSPLKNLGESMLIKLPRAKWEECLKIYPESQILKKIMGARK